VNRCRNCILLTGGKGDEHLMFRRRISYVRAFLASINLRCASEFGLHWRNKIVVVVIDGLLRRLKFPDFFRHSPMLQCSATRIIHTVHTALCY